jgi:hypothetical protein
MTPRLVYGAALLAALAVAAPIALADPPPPTGDGSPSYGGNPPTGDQSPSYGGNPASTDHTAPHMRATISTRHLRTVAKTGRLRLSLGTDEGAVVALTGTLTAKAPHVKTLKLKLKSTTLLYKRAGQKTGTLTLTAAERRKLKALLAAGGKKASGKVTVTGTGADASHNKRHLTKTAKLVR